MNKLLRGLTLLWSLVAVVGCNSDTPEDAVVEAGTAPHRVYALCESAASRTFVDEQLTMRWSADDRISLFAKNTANMQYLFEGCEGDTEGSFVQVSPAVVAGQSIAHNIAVYPYMPTTVVGANEQIFVDVAATASYAENSFGVGSNIMVARSGSASLGFRNCCGYLKLQLYGDVAVSRIELCGNNNEILAGRATIAIAEDGTPVMTMVEGGTTLTLDCGEGVVLSNSKAEPTTFWFALPPVTFSKGITVAIYDGEERVVSKSTTKQVPITRNEVQPMSSFEPLFASVGVTMSAISGCWHLTSWRGAEPSFDVYMDIDSSGNVVLYQRIASRNWEVYHSTAELEDSTISGVYSDGVAWSASYGVAASGNTMTWTDTSDPSDISIYTRAELPTDIVVTRAECSDYRFL
ncbi:MAG: hypothetical protein II288_01620 [Alistipes sp.]|nr:hypothetical protein [Alistipes sp.]